MYVRNEMICIIVCRYVCMHSCMYECMHACMQACTHACMYVCMYVMYACNVMNVCMYVCMYVRMYFFAHVCQGSRLEPPVRCGILIDLNAKSFGCICCWRNLQSPYFNFFRSSLAWLLAPTSRERGGWWGCIFGWSRPLTFTSGSRRSSKVCLNTSPAGAGWRKHHPMPWVSGR